MSIKDKLKKKKPFLTFAMAGVNGSLMDEGNFLTVAFKPPQPELLLKNKLFTTIITKYSSVLKDVKGQGADKEKLQNVVQQKISNVTLEEQLNDSIQMIEFSKEFITSHSVECWWDETAPEKITWVESEEEADKLNVNLPDGEVAISITRVSNEELIDVTKLLIGDEIFGTPANVEITPDEPEELLDILSTDAGGDSTVPADKFRRVPRTLRNTPVSNS